MGAARGRHARPRQRLLASVAILLAGSAVLWVVTPSTAHAQNRAASFASAHGSTMLRPGEVPPLLAEAIIATEDERFYQHHGVDVVGIGRAALADLRSRCLCQGASTLTEQLMKELYLGGSDSGWKKVEDVVLAIKVETHVGKCQLLADYLSDAPSGAGLYGMTAASCQYYGIPLGRLDLGQAAMLAGMPQAPSAYDPIRHPTAARQRRREVLAAMVSEGYITAQAAAIAAAEPALTRSGPPDVGCAAPGIRVAGIIGGRAGSPAA
ncbi:MAG: transglycosylase domain-containing protein [Candidatus Dormibacteria bacterium]